MNAPKKAPVRRVELFTSKARGQIVRRLSERHTWKGTRKGVRVFLTLTAQPDFEGNRVAWKAKIGGQWQDGRAGNGFDAMTQIETAAAKHRLTQGAA